MASTEQTDLSDFIKSVHKKLRQDAEVLGIEQAWENHCNDKEKLEKYAKTMQDLAVNHWDKNSEKDSKVVSRVMWVYEACKEYFSHIDKYRDKEVRIARHYLECEVNIFNNKLSDFSNPRYKLLDVGSCYNPFIQFEIFDVLSVDIAPANPQVLKCDFLTVGLSDNLLIKDNVIKDLPRGHFDVIVFSLLLEYFPSPLLRLKCCLNAYDLLTSEGILLIITPDSNHVGSNARTIKSWRYVLARHGFSRVKYEKLPYLHCMVFRKAPLRAVAQHWAEVRDSKEFLDHMYIPQDFQDSRKKQSRLKQNENVQ